MFIVALLDETHFNVIYLDVKIYHDATLKKKGYYPISDVLQKELFEKTLASNE